MDSRIGRQTPTTALRIPYTVTKGQEAIDLYEKTGRTAMEWQKIQIYDIMAVGDDGLWSHATYGYAVPRRNGKTEDAIMRMMWGLMNGEKVLYTAHLISTAHSVWEVLTYLLDAAGIPYASVKAKGQENIRLIDETGSPYKLDHLVNFRTRSNTGGLGEGYDLLIIDEAQEYTIDQESALKYTISASDNPQTVMMGTPPTTNSKGTVFSKLREKVLMGESRYTGWAEWSVESLHDPSDRDAWYETNPSLGIRLTERVIENENTTDDIDFNVQRLGHWLSYTQQSAITKKEWESLKITVVPRFRGKLSVGIKFGHDGTNVALSIAVRTKDKIFVECVDCQSIRNGYLWIVDFLRSADFNQVIIDGAGAQNVLADELRDYGIRKNQIVLPTVKEVITANALFEKSAISDKSIIHNDQPSVTEVISNCQKRVIGSNNGFGYRAMDDRREIAIMDSIILAHWLCSQSKTRKKQKISY